MVYRIFYNKGIFWEDYLYKYNSDFDMCNVYNLCETIYLFQRPNYKSGVMIYKKRGKFSACVWQLALFLHQNWILKLMRLQQHIECLYSLPSYWISLRYIQFQMTNLIYSYIRLMSYSITLIVRLKRYGVRLYFLSSYLR